VKIEIVEPRADWAVDFLKLKTIVMRAVPANASIHHIGSTAVPGLAAKDIIDIQITVDDLAQVDASVFEQQGFRRSSVVSDHCPPGIVLDEEELRKQLFRTTQGRSANVHIRERGRFNQRYPLLCRDFLRSHPIAAQAYGLIKQRLAARFPDDEDFYYDIKDPVFDMIVEGADAWAKAVGWSEPPGD
jgi:GrpB-like predicted nucleotidyltransferase (UPF0157 family)